MSNIKRLLILPVLLTTGPLMAMGERINVETEAVSRPAKTLVTSAFGAKPGKQEKQRAVGWKIRPDGATASNVLVNRKTAYLYASGFGMEIPEDAEIKGLEVVVKRQRSLFGAVMDESVRLVVEGGPAGADKADAGEQWADTPQEVVYGGVNDTWGLRIEPEQVNRDDFGVALKASMMPFDNPQTAHIHQVILVVHYNTGT